MCKPPKNQIENEKIQNEKLSKEEYYKTESKEYYKPVNLWGGQKAIRKLFQNTGISKEIIKSWLAKQTLWQVHIPPPKNIQHPHYQVTIP